MTFDPIPNGPFNPGTAAATQPDQLRRQIELSYVAGFTDGEAYVGFSKTQQPGRKHPTYRLTFSFTQNNLGSLKRVARILGVPVRIYEVKRLTQHNKQIYTLAIGDKDAYDALVLLLPYLDRKHVEATIALEAYVACHLDKHPGCKGHSAEVWKLRERYYWKLRKLK